MKRPHFCALHAVALFACLFGGGIRVAAHDLWIEVSSFITEPTKPLAVRLRVGVDLLGDPVGRESAHIDRFVLIDANGRSQTVPGQEGLDPAGLLRGTSPGLLVIGYSTRPSPIVLPAEKFNQYLAEEGLESIAALRAQRKQTAADAREEFSRCAKALLSSGTVSNAHADRALGFPLELVAERNPYALGTGQTLPLRLLFRGKPLSGALVVAINKRNPSARVSARSGKDGKVKFAVDSPGMWLVKAVHMIPATSESSAEWASFWASLTFERAATSPARGAQ